MNTLVCKQASSIGLRLLIACFCLFSLRPVAFAQPGMLHAEQEDYLAGLRIDGLHGDRSKIPEMIEALKRPEDRYVSTALHALKHLHASEALPDIEALMQKEQAGLLYEHARAARARILADPEAVPMTEASRQANPALSAASAEADRQAAQSLARVSVQRLLLELNLNVEKINAGAEAWQRAKAKGDVAWNGEMMALDELADMAYYGSYEAYAALPEFKALDFSRCPEAALKIKFAAVPRPLRAQRLVEFMAKTGGGLQLAIDEGLPASHAAAAKLKEMDTHREQYALVQGETTSYPGFLPLFRLITSIGDKEQMPLLEHFTHDRDTWISSYAYIAVGAIKRGLRRQWIAGY